MSANYRLLSPASHPSNSWPRHLSAKPDIEPVAMELAPAGLRSGPKERTAEQSDGSKLPRHRLFIACSNLSFTGISLAAQFPRRSAKLAQHRRRKRTLGTVTDQIGRAHV